MVTYNRSKANLGKQLENLIDMTNNQYRNAGVADIRKIPTPVQITGNNRGRVSGRLLKGEWVDYVGIYYGTTIVFDVKETSSATSFPLANISDHQYDLLQSWHQKGAAAFLVIQFTKKFEEIYILQFYDLEQWWIKAQEGGRKSIPYQFFVDYCRPVKSADGYTLHYLRQVDTVNVIKVKEEGDGNG